MNTLPSRRNFLKTAAMGVAATGLTSAGLTAVATPAPKNKSSVLKLGLMTYTLGKDWDIETLIKNCSETGWVHAELRTTHKHGVEVSLSKQARSDVKKRFQDSPLEAISLASAFSYHHADPKVLRENIEGTKEYLQLAHDVGATGIRVFPNAFPEGVSREKTMEQIGKSLSEVGEFGHNLGVDVRVCVHGKGTDEIPVIKTILGHAESKHVYVNWNCSMNDVKGEGLKKNFDAVKDRIKGVHMHELYSDYPYREFFKLLRNSGYSGYCNAEIDQSCEPITLMHYYRGLFLALQDAL
jgi:sugar phosphate isomerase/epimerase